jgi:hypothetical protein
MRIARNPDAMVGDWQVIFLDAITGCGLPDGWRVLDGLDADAQAEVARALVRHLFADFDVQAVVESLREEDSVAA